MGGFDAGRSVAALEYDFTTIHGFESLPEETREILKNAKGIVAEPSQDALERYEQAKFRVMTETELPIEQIMQVAALGPDPTEAEIAAILGGIGDIDFEALPKKAQQAKLALQEAVIDVCGGNPSAEQLKALPGRIFEAFAGWLDGQLRPTRPTPASTPSRAAVNGASAVT